jgi:peptide/nickel transport system permease protein
MLQFILRRLVQTVFVMFCVTALSFGTMFLSGDPTMVMAGENWTKDQVAEFRHLMGFDRPWYVQYGDFLVKASHGDFGNSLRQQQPAFAIVKDRMPATAQLAGAAMLVAILAGVPLGVLAALKRGTWWDNLLMMGGLVGQAMPIFWSGLLMIMIFSVRLHWFPVAGRGTPAHLVLPAITLGLFPAAYFARVARSSMLEVLGCDYIRTARSKGLSEEYVIIRHALRNALIPLVTVVGLEAGHLLGGAVLTETIFAWPGVGRLVIQAVQGKDLPLVQACVVSFAAIFVLVNLLVDILYTYLDPRIRLT